MRLKYFSAVSFLCLVFPLFAEGAVLYFSPDNSSYNKNDVFKVDVRLDTQEESINACSLKIKYDSAKLSVQNISEGNSLLFLWAQKPSYLNDEGLIMVAGGVPSGFSGDGKIISIFFQAIETGAAEVSFIDDSAVFLNDGKGTMAKANKEKAVFQIIQAGGNYTRNEWEENITIDEIPPEPFRITLARTPAVFNGKYFIVFSTTDNQSGINHYEIKEGEDVFRVGESPYLLENQELNNKIYVKAIDNAGNETISQITSKEEPLILKIILIIAVLVICGFFIYRIALKPKKS